jgi:hypothetical protein
MILYRLSTHPDPNWDCQTVRKTVNLVHILQDLVRLTRRASVDAGERSGQDLFAQFAEFLHAFQVRVHALFTGEPAQATPWPYGSSVNDTAQRQPVVNSRTPVNQLQSVDLGNNVWLGNIFDWL